MNQSLTLYILHSVLFKNSAEKLKFYMYNYLDKNGTFFVDLHQNKEMRFILLLFFVAFYSFVIAQNNTVPVAKSNLTKTTKTNTQQTVKPVNKPANKPVVATSNNDNKKPEKCLSCPATDGLILSTNTNGVFSFDSLIKEYTSTINTTFIGGYWNYQNTLLIDKQGHLVNKIRTYFTQKKEFDGAVASKYKNVDPNNPSTMPNDNDLIDEAINRENRNAEYLGRSGQNFLEENILFLEPNVQYVFFDKAGETEDNYTIWKRNQDKSIEPLLTADIRFSFASDLSSKKTFMIFTEFGRKTSKKFLLLKLSNESFVLCDEQYKEFHFFSRLL